MGKRSKPLSQWHNVDLKDNNINVNIKAELELVCPERKMVKISPRHLNYVLYHDYRERSKKLNNLE